LLGDDHQVLELAGGALRHQGACIMCVISLTLLYVSSLTMAAMLKVTGIDADPLDLT
jgi:hypothetical protein